MKLLIEIDLDNDAFKDDQSAVLGRIFGYLTTDGFVEGEVEVIEDTDGVPCGTVKLLEGVTSDTLEYGTIEWLIGELNHHDPDADVRLSDGSIPIPMENTPMIVTLTPSGAPKMVDKLNFDSRGIATCATCGMDLNHKMECGNPECGAGP